MDKSERLALIDTTLREILHDLQSICRSQYNLTHHPMNQGMLEEAIEFWEHGEYGLSFEYLVSAMLDVESCISTRSAYKLVRLGIMMREIFQSETWLKIDPAFGTMID